MKNCKEKCKYKCSTKINDEERNRIFVDFYDNRNKDRQYDYIAETTKREKINATRSKRQCSFKYQFILEDEPLQVCKEFYLGTLSISQKVVYNVHDKKDSFTGRPKSDGRGKHQKKVIQEDMCNDVRNHILSFPTVDSHYCRFETTRKYLESNLNVRKMYDLYAQKCTKEQLKMLKETYYRYIFKTEFNLAFHQLKKDRCDKCEAYKAQKNNSVAVTEIEESNYQEHLSEKTSMRANREADKQSGQPVLCFELENVITLPKAEISSFFYKRKLNLYNMTGHLVEPTRLLLYMDGGDGW